MNQETIHTPIVQLPEAGDLSAHAINICEDNHLHYLSSLLQYYSEHKSFFKLRSCGNKTNAELLKLCRKYEHLIPKKQYNHQDPGNTAKLLSIVGKLTYWQYEILNNIIKLKTKELSQRSYNSLLRYLGFPLDLNGYIAILNDAHFSIKHLRNVGGKSEKELKYLFDEVARHVYVVSTMYDEEDLKTEFFRTFLNEHFTISGNILDEIVNEYDFSRGIPVFMTLQWLLSNEILFNRKEEVIFEKGLKYNNKTAPASIKEISEASGVIPERIRQTRYEVYINLDKKLSFLTSLDLGTISLYGIDIYSGMIQVDDDVVAEINQQEKNSFNRLFIKKVLSILLSDAYTLIGDKDYVAYNQYYYDRHNWKDYYLIRNELVRAFDFDTYVDHLSKRTTASNNSQEYSLNFEGYVKNFRKTDFDKYAKDILKIAEYILFNEFGIKKDREHNIVFKRNTPKRIHEHIYDILESRNKPLSIHELFDILRKNYSIKAKSAESIRVHCMKDPDIVSCGRNGLYGLKKWEEKGMLKRDTIKDIVREYLNRYDEPRHMDEIVEYVRCFRPGMKKQSLLFSLRSAGAGRKTFRFFKNNHVGLASRSYGNDEAGNEKFPPARRSWNENFELLEKFAASNKRLPRLTKDSKEETRLYRFMSIQIRKAEAGELQETELQRLKSLLITYRYAKRGRRQAGENQK